MLLQNLRAKVGARLNGDKEAGFTLIELLVVMLILGILAAIALPAFFNQKSKAGDAKAKETAHSLQVAMETCATDHSSSYESCNQAALHAIEPTIPQSGGGITVTTTADTYGVRAQGSSSTQWFEIARSNVGAITYPCEVGGQGGCTDDDTPAGAGTWGS